MSDFETPLASLTNKRLREDALQGNRRKRPNIPDPLVHHGRHFGRVAFAFCNIKVLLTNGLLSLTEEAPPPDETSRECRERILFMELLKLCPDLEERILASSEEEVGLIADLIEKGVKGARADDTKTMKTAIVDWITLPGQTTNPPLNRKIKTTRGFHHERTGALLCPAGIDWALPNIKEKLRSGEMHVRGDQWPIFLYADLAYDADDPWNGLMRSQLLVSGFKHIFTSPSSVEEDEPKATKSGNARIHGMTRVTEASLAYVATQVRFALCSSSTFSRTDSATDSETFYNSILDLLRDVQEKEEVQDLLNWWNRKIFPHTFTDTKVPIEGSALCRIRERRNARNLLMLSY